MTHLAPALATLASVDAPALGGAAAAWVPTPGYHFHGRPTRLEIKLSTTKKGQRRAMYYSRNNRRWMPMPVAEAELLLAQDLADAYEAPAAGAVSIW